MKSDEPPLPLIWRSERIVLPPSGRLERVASGWRMLTPDNPGYWWGNVLVMDHAPARGDLARWQRQFRDLIHAPQPQSTHMTFTWAGPEQGEIEPFLAAGYVPSRLLVMRASHLHAARAADAAVTLREFGEPDWEDLEDMLVSGHVSSHGQAAYRTFLSRSIANWRRLARSDLGNWFGAFADNALVAGLGIFVEKPAESGRVRLARFQSVLTAPAWRNKGICSALAYEAARQTAIRHAPSEFVIQADEKQAARRIYQRLGFQIESIWLGLERGSGHDAIAP